MNKELSKEERRRKTDLEERMDIDDSDIIIQGAQSTRLSRKQVRKCFPFQYFVSNRQEKTALFLGHLFMLL